MVNYKAHSSSDFWKSILLIWLFGFMFFVLCYLKFVHKVVLLHDPTVTLELLVAVILQA